ncbi:MAG: L,D-transpeptidase family protein [Pseudomonadota bacterium]|jgi:hypothetical protein
MARLHTNSALLALAAILVPCSAMAALSPTLAKNASSSLRPGQFLWDETDSGTGPVAIMVSIDRQHLYVYRDGALIGVSTVSTGKPGKDTPLGEFRILQKNVHHRSNIYSNAPMPYMQRLTWGGIAIHGGQLPGYPASHGCIRVPLAFAKKLFAATDMGGVVSVSDGQSGPFLRIEVDVASLSVDIAPAWDGRVRDIQLATQAAPPPPMRVATLPPVKAAIASAPRDVPTAPPPKLKVDRVVLARADIATPPTAGVSGSDQPHWLVPFYQDAAVKAGN